MFKLIAKLMLFIPLLAGMMFVSYRVDPSGLFWGAGFERMASEYMLDGVYIDGYERLDGRALNEVYAKNVPYSPQILITGSSRSLMINDTFFPDYTFYNASNVSADRFDLMTSYYIFAKENKQPEVFIMGIDGWLFNDGEENIDGRSNKELYYEFIGEELGIENTSYEKTDPYEKYKALIVPSYFQGSVKYFLKDKSADVRPEPVHIDEIYNQNEVIKCPDGSIIYDKKFREHNEETVDLIVSIESEYEPLRLGNFHDVDMDYARIFEQFLTYLQEKGVRVVFYLPPYHSRMYATIESNPNHVGLLKTEKYLLDIAQKYDIDVVGSYDPETAGVENRDFYDSVHLKPEAVRRILSKLDI